MIAVNVQFRFAVWPRTVLRTGKFSGWRRRRREERVYRCAGIRTQSRERIIVKAGSFEIPRSNATDSSGQYAMSRVRTQGPRVLRRFTVKADSSSLNIIRLTGDLYSKRTTSIDEESRVRSGRGFRHNATKSANEKLFQGP
jgi:hypothetical protein